MKMKTWIVWDKKYNFTYKDYRYNMIDEVFFEEDMTMHDVKRSLVDHDGYNSTIKLEERI